MKKRSIWPVALVDGGRHGYSFLQVHYSFLSTYHWWESFRLWLDLYTEVQCQHLKNGDNFIWLPSSLTTTTTVVSFGFDSRISGVILMADNFAEIALNPVVGYFSVKYNRARMVATGEVIIALSCFLTGKFYYSSCFAQISNHVLLLNTSTALLCLRPCDSYAWRHFTAIQIKLDQLWNVQRSRPKSDWLQQRSGHHYLAGCWNTAFRVVCSWHRKHLLLGCGISRHWWFTAQVALMEEKRNSFKIFLFFAKLTGPSLQCTLLPCSALV